MNLVQLEYFVIGIHHGGILFFPFHFKKAQQKEKTAFTQYNVLWV